MMNLVGARRSFKIFFVVSFGSSPSGMAGNVKNIFSAFA
jgi:hypothetical protein